MCNEKSVTKKMKVFENRLDFKLTSELNYNEDFTRKKTAFLANISKKFNQNN